MKIETVLQQLIRTPSVSGQEKEIQEWIFQYLVSVGFSPQWVGPNVVVKIAGKNTKKALIFNGHVDTVSPGDEKAWNYGPWNAKIIGNKLYGLGSSDMKSGIAVMLKVIEKYTKIQSPVDLWFHFVVKEETDGSGTGEIMAWFEKTQQTDYKEIAGIISEPTDLTKIEIAHKGNIFLQITTHGDGGHGSEPEKLKQHAVPEMLDVQKQLQNLVGKWGKNYKDTLLGKPTIVMTSISAGDPTSPNKIADMCTATFDLRTTPQVHDKALGLISKQLKGITTVKTVYDPLPYGYTSPSEKIVKLTKEITHLPLGSTPGSTDMLFFTALGIPAIILGPGSKGCEHAVNEYTEISNLMKCLKIFEEIIENF